MTNKELVNLYYKHIGSIIDGDDVCKKTEEVLNFTDDDFKDDDKLKDFLDVTDSIIEDFNDIDDSFVTTLVNLVVGGDFSEKIVELQDGAIRINSLAHESDRRVNNKPKHASKIEELADKFINEEIVPKCVKEGKELNLRECEDVKFVLTEFGKFILKQ